ncbi:hypothetical protein ACFVKC_40495 [Streptomyces noursei]|uniref:hypothetical protein n=1 Tax=Streptomyces noursei TaxID=1971 RepID=UPI00362E9357
MTDKERLKVIKRMYDLGIELLNFDINWLIQQAEKVESLENEGFKEVLIESEAK